MTEEPQNTRESAEPASRRRIVIIAAVVLAVVLALLLMRCAQPRDLAPQQDVAAQSTDEEEPKMDAAEGGGAVNITFTQDVSVDLGARSVAMYLKNPSRSTHDMSIELLVQDGEERVSIAKSGLVPAGYELRSLELSDEVRLHPGSYSGLFKVSFYDPETSESAYVDTEIPLPDIRVVE